MLPYALAGRQTAAAVEDAGWGGDGDDEERRGHGGSCDGVDGVRCAIRRRPASGRVTASLMPQLAAAVHVHGDCLVSLIAHWLTVWAGFYLLTRRPRSLATVLAAMAMLSMAAYVVGVAFLDASHSRAEAVLWGRLYIWAPTLASLLWFHSMLELTETSFRLKRWLLAVGYGAVCVLAALGLTATLVYDYYGPAPHPGARPGAFPLGVLFPLYAGFVLVCLAAAVAVVVRRRRRRGTFASAVLRQLDWLLAGTSLFLLGSTLIFATAFADWPVPEGYLQTLLLLGAVIIAYPVLRFRGIVEGQLLWRDLKASLLRASALMAVFVVCAIAAGASSYVLAATGWFVLAAFVFDAAFRGLADLPFYGAQARVDRADLQTAARFVGARSALDIASLLPGQSDGLVDFASEVERAGLASGRLQVERGLWTHLLAQASFAAVRQALDLPEEWTPEQPYPDERVKESVAQRLEPRERQAVGLKYLGFSDREMARLMQVRPNVPRSYLSEAKRKLELPAGAPLNLFAHFSGVVIDDALPLLGVTPEALEPPEDAREAALGTSGASDATTDGQGDSLS